LWARPSLITALLIAWWSVTSRLLRTILPWSILATRFWRTCLLRRRGRTGGLRRRIFTRAVLALVIFLFEAAWRTQVRFEELAFLSEHRADLLGIELFVAFEQLHAHLAAQHVHVFDAAVAHGRVNALANFGQALAHVTVGVLLVGETTQQTAALA
jgi:hypothetical protein